MTPSAKKVLLTEKLQAAKSVLAKAEADLELAIGEIRTAPRADKVAMSDVLDDAFEKLRLAKSTLLEIEALVGEGPEIL